MKIVRKYFARYELRLWLLKKMIHNAFFLRNISSLSSSFKMSFSISAISAIPQSIPEDITSTFRCWNIATNICTHRITHNSNIFWQHFKTLMNARCNFTYFREIYIKANYCSSKFPYSQPHNFAMNLAFAEITCGLLSRQLTSQSSVDLHSQMTIDRSINND